MLVCCTVAVALKKTTWVQAVACLLCLCLAYCFSCRPREKNTDTGSVFVVNEMCSHLLANWRLLAIWKSCESSCWLFRALPVRKHTLLHCMEALNSRHRKVKELQLESKNLENVFLGKCDKQKNCLEKEEQLFKANMSDPWWITGRALNNCCFRGVSRSFFCESHYSIKLKLRASRREAVYTWNSVLMLQWRDCCNDVEKNT